MPLHTGFHPTCAVAFCPIYDTARQNFASKVRRSSWENHLFRFTYCAMERRFKNCGSHCWHNFRPKRLIGVVSATKQMRLLQPLHRPFAQSSKLTPTRLVYFVHHLAWQLDDVHSPNADPCASTNLHLAHRIHKKMDAGETLPHPSSNFAFKPAVQQIQVLYQQHFLRI